MMLLISLYFIAAILFICRPGPKQDRAQHNVRAATRSSNRRICDDEDDDGYEFTARRQEVYLVSGTGIYDGPAGCGGSTW
jgi:hypothetical protein